MPSVYPVGIFFALLSFGHEFTNYPDIDNMYRLIAPLSTCKQQELLEQEQERESGPRFD